MRIEIKDNCVEFYKSKFCKDFKIDYKDEFELNLIKYFASLYFANPKRIKMKGKAIEYACYWFVVWNLTEQNSVFVPKIELRGKGVHLDHIVPISYGFENNINPHLIASTDNLQIIPAKDNLKKSCIITQQSINVLKIWDLW